MVGGLGSNKEQWTGSISPQQVCTSGLSHTQWKGGCLFDSCRIGRFTLGSSVLKFWVIPMALLLSLWAPMITFPMWSR